MYFYVKKKDKEEYQIYLKTNSGKIIPENIRLFSESEAKKRVLELNRQQEALSQNTYTCSPDTPLDQAKIENAINELLKSQVKFKSSNHVEKNHIMTMDCEKIRRECVGNWFDELFLRDLPRGKIIFYNPADETSLKSKFPPIYFE